jgi:hypothetical protein
MKQNVIFKVAWFATGCAFTLAVIFLVHQWSKMKRPEPDVIFATVDGKKIYSNEILSKVRAQLNEIHRSEYDVEKRKTEEVIDQILLGPGAVKLPPPNPASVATLDGKTLSPHVKGALPQIKKSYDFNEARQKLIHDLRAKAKIQILIPEPVAN